MLVKLRLDDPSGGALHRLEALEAVSVGIEGKRLLWRALAAAAEGTPGLPGPITDAWSNVPKTSAGGWRRSVWKRPGKPSEGPPEGARCRGCPWHGTCMSHD